MAKYIEKIEQLTLPVIALRGAVAFPGSTLNFEIDDELSLGAAEAAFDTDSFVFICACKNIDAPETDPSNLFSVGTVSKIKQSVKTAEGGVRIIAEGFSRATAVSYNSFANYIAADLICKTVSVSDEDSVKSQAHCRAMLSEVEKLTSLLPSASDKILLAAKSIKNPALLADFIAANILVKHGDKQKVLECYNPTKRVELLVTLINEEVMLLECELNIHKQVRANLNQNQKDFYLREQIRVIQNELGESGEVEEYLDKIDAAKLPKEVEEKLLKEVDRMSKTPFGSSEATVIRSYLDTCLEIPWSTATKDRINVKTAERILNEDHDGLEKVKERILEFLAVKQLNPSLGNQIICLVGPPGVGKTSIGASIARALNRKYVRVSLGGVRDEADIRGHRKTYIGAMPGRIIAALTQAKVKNPLILLDEIDKMSSSIQGDPSSALLEVLDSEQNKTFRDHFVEMPFDLSDCLFIATANTLSTVPRPLIDRMEVIELTTYTKSEKLAIAKHHLIPKQLKRHGLSSKNIAFADDAIIETIDFYTREAGVRNLERSIASIIRKAAKIIVENGEDAKKIKITAKNVPEYLGARKRLPERISADDEIGVVNGLAWTEVGGDMLRVEVAILEGTGKIELTGSLGDVMKESAKTAVSYVRMVASQHGIDPGFYKDKDIHIHFPEGAVPKDGPSAGVTMVTALISALSGRAVKRDVAMTGEVSLRGKVLAIGGLKEKTLAAYSAGVRTVLIPEDNLKDLENIDPLVKETLTFIACRDASDVLKHALCSVKTKTAASEQTLKTIREATIPADSRTPAARVTR